MMIIGLVTKMITTTMIGGNFNLKAYDESLYLSFGMYVLLLFGDGGGGGVLANGFNLYKLVILIDTASC